MVQDNLHAHAHLESCLFVKRGISKTEKLEVNHWGKEENNNKKKQPTQRFGPKGFGSRIWTGPGPFGWVGVRVGRSDYRATALSAS